MKNKKLIFGVLFAGVLAVNTLVLSTNNNNDLQLNSLFTLASAQAEDGEEGETWIVTKGSVKETVEKYYDCPKCGGQNTFYIKKISVILLAQRVEINTALMG